MKENAIAKIKAEMEADKTNGVMAGAGELLIDYIEKHPDAAAAVMAEGTTMKKACQAMQDEARRRAGGKGSFCMRDADGLALVLEYFGIKAAGAHEPAKHESVPAPSAADVDLDALLGL